MINLSSIEHLSTSRLTLSPVTLNDVDYVYQVFQLESTVEFDYIAPFTDQEQAVKLIQAWQKRQENNTGIRLIMKLVDTNETIGSIGLFSISERRGSAEIGYEMHPNYWGNGYMHEAVMRALQISFNDWKLHRISATICTENPRSRAVIEKVGFKLEGIARQSERNYKGELYDECLYARLRGDGV